MMRSLLAAVSGLRNHQIRMDVIGNNVSNVNTVAFKAGRATFKEGFSQLLQSATKPNGSQGGVNPIQVGLGMQIGSIDTLFNQGNLENTGMATDLAIQGDSFFVVAKGNQQYFTRAGNFQLDADGNLVSPTNGASVQGRMAVNGVLQDGITAIRLPFGQRSAAQATSSVTVAGNLDAAASAGPPADTATANTMVYDSLGNKHELTITFTKTANAGEWSYAVTTPTTGATFTGGNTGTVTFDPATGMLTSTFANIQFSPGNGAAALDVAVTAEGTTNGLTQFQGSSMPVLKDQNGHGMGDLKDFSIDRTGTITGAFSNGTTMVLGQIVLADFNNPGGLMRAGDNMYGISGNSGGAVLSFSGEGTQSSVAAGALEMSNVDLAQEFTSMIVAQRGFQANGRVITSSDEMLQEVVNLKR